MVTSAGLTSPKGRLCQRVAKRCCGGHAHQPIVNGMAKETGRYSPQLMIAILPCLRDELRGGEHVWRLDTLECGPTLEEADFTD